MSIYSTKKEIIKSLVFRAVGMSFGFITVALLVRDMGAASYGTWAALSSFLAWIQLSDFGVGNALKNRIASAVKPVDLIYLISGVFQFYLLVSFSIAALFYMFGDYLTIVKQYRNEAMILYLGAFILFPLTIGSAILQGLRKNSTSILISFVQSFIWLLCVLVLINKDHSSLLSIPLLWLSSLYILAVLIGGLIQCIIAGNTLFGGGVKELRQLFNFANLKLALPLWGIGGRFILLQVSSVILFSLGTYLTYSNLSPEETAKYDILFRIFQIPILFFSVIISVYWVDIARSIKMNESLMLKRKFMQMHAIAMITALLLLLCALFVVSPFVDIYSSNKIHSSVADALCFWLLITVQMFAYSGAVFLNAAEKLGGQIILAVIASALLIPTVLFFHSLGLGFSAVPLATALLIVPSLIYCNWAAYIYVIKKTAKIHI